MSVAIKAKEVGFVAMTWQKPPQPGHYIVLHRHGRRQTQWVRYWDGETFRGNSEVQYGNITHWSFPLPLPESNR